MRLRYDVNQMRQTLRIMGHFRENGIPFYHWVFHSDGATAVVYPPTFASIQRCAEQITHDFG